MKFCKDCKWIVNRHCRHEKSLLYLDPVDGGKDYIWCDEMRRLNKKCGEDAKYFEPGLFYKIKRMIWK